MVGAGRSSEFSGEEVHWQGWLVTLVRTEVEIGFGRRLGIVHGLLLGEESALADGAHDDLSLASGAPSGGNIVPIVYITGGSSK